MKQIIYIVAYLCIICLIASCNLKEPVSDSYAIIEVTTSESKGNDWFDIVDTIVIPLETVNESLIGSIAEICHEDSFWYILTGESSVLKFDKSGKFISSIGSKGNGPGEYTRINTMCICDNLIYLNIGNEEKVCIYDTSGNWIKNISGTGCLKFAMSMKPIGKGKFLVANSANFNNEIPLYGIWDSSKPHKLTELVSTNYSFQGSYSWAMNPFVQFNGAFIALKPLSSTVYKLNAEISSCDSLINITGCIPEDIMTSGNYKEAFNNTIRDNGNPILAVNANDNFVFISLLKGFTIVHIPSGKWWYTNTQAMSLQESPFPFVLDKIGCSFDDKLVCIVTPSTYLNVYAGQPGFKKFGLDDIDLEDNPILMIYTLKYIGDK